MNSIVRTLVALLLCALLPLQAGAALVRSTSMSASHAVRSASINMQRAAPLDVATGDHAQHGHHSHQAKPAAEHLPMPDAAPSHKQHHAKAECQSCAKCCLMAASAPPPVLTPALAPAVTRTAFIPSADPAPAFLTDGPERPPRFPSA